MDWLPRLALMFMAWGGILFLVWVLIQTMR